MAPLGPLRECCCPCALQPSYCTRASLHLGWSCHCCSVASVVALENAHCSSIFYVVWYLIPAFHYSDREKMSPGIQPCSLWPQIEWTVCTSGGSCWLRGHMEPSFPIHFIKSSHILTVWIISAWCRLSSSELSDLIPKVSGYSPFLSAQRPWIWLFSEFSPTLPYQLLPTVTRLMTQILDVALHTTHRVSRRCSCLCSERLLSFVTGLFVLFWLPSHTGPTVSGSSAWWHQYPSPLLSPTLLWSPESESVNSELRFRLRSGSGTSLNYL